MVIRRPAGFIELGLAADDAAPSLMRRPHRHSEIEINYLQGGRIDYLLGHDLVSLPAGRMGLFWAARPHRIIHLEAIERFYWLTVPLATFLQWSPGQVMTDMLMSGQMLVDPEPAPTDANIFKQWRDDLKRGNTQLTRIAAMEIQARVLRLGLSIASQRNRTHADRARPPAEGAIKHVVRIASRIGSTYDQPVRVAEIAESVGLHPKYATTLFRKHVGMSIQAYLTQQRLYHAQRLLSETDDNTDLIAFASGFGAVSRFYEAFKRELGVTPRQYRQQIRGQGEP